MSRLHHGHIMNQPKPYPCSKCNRSYRSKGALARHINVECGLPARHVCIICDKGFKQKANFQRHNATIHGHLFAQQS